MSLRYQAQWRTKHKQLFFQIFSTPEVHIGFHPDAGASFYLSHLPGHVGMQYSLCICIIFFAALLLLTSCLYKLIFLIKLCSYILGVT
jgi:Enoyl-CoA hydratase/isomerase